MDSRQTIVRADPDPRIARIVRHYRTHAGLTRDQLAKAANCSVWTLVKIENGSRGVGTSMLGRLGQVLGPEFARRMLAVLAEG